MGSIPERFAGAEMKTLLITLWILATFTRCYQTAPEDRDIQIHRFDKDTTEETYVARPVNRQHEFPLSMFAMIQAIDESLFIAPFGRVDTYVLFRYYFGNETHCCPELKGFISYGRGPKESESLSMSAKTFSQDSVLFYSSNSNRYTVITGEGNSAEVTIDAKPNMGYMFAYGNGKLLTSIFNPMFETENLFHILDINTGDEKTFVKARVPFGYEPAIRNLPSAVASTPTGFAIAFVGDKGIQFYDYNGQLFREYIFGESEPVRIRKKGSSSEKEEASNPYILKIEYYEGSLFVLIQQHLWVIDFEKNELISRLKILEDPDQETAPLNDFSIGEDKIFLRFRRDDLAYIPLEDGWYRK